MNQGNNIEDRVSKVKNYVILTLIALIAILLTLRQCEGPKPGKTTIITKDTSWTDTIRIPQEVIKFKPKYYPKWDTAYIDTSSHFNEDLCKFTRVYADSVSDSNVTIYSNIETQGILKSSQVKYKLKVPIYIKETHEFHDEVIIPNKWDIYADGEVGGNLERLNLSIGGSIRYKNIVYGYRYGLIDKTHNIRIGYRLFKSKK